MKLTVLQEDLSKALAIASRFVNIRAQLPILSNILIKTDKNKLVISATNLEMSYSTHIGAKVDEEGELAVPAKIVSDFVSSLPKGQLTLGVEKESLRFESEHTNAKIPGVNPSEYPVIPSKVGKSSVKLSSQAFIDLISHVLFASSSDETRPVLTGVLTIFEEGKITLVSTDGFRLSKKACSYDGSVKSTVILPKGALAEIARMGGESENIEMTFNKDDNQAVFSFGNSVMSTRIIDGEFPKYEKIIPSASSIKVNVGKEDLLAAVKSASVFARDSSNFVTFVISKSSFELSSKSSTSGKQSSLVDAKISGVDSKSVEISFNYKFVEDFLNSVKGSSVDIKLNDGNSSGIFLDSNDKEYLHLIMPVKV